MTDTDDIPDPSPNPPPGANSGANSGADRDPDAGWGADLSRAAGCLTVLWHDRSGSDPAAMAAAARAFPVIGLGLAAVAAAAYGLGDGLGFYGLASAALALGLVACLTGARGETGAAAFVVRLFGDATDEPSARQAGLVVVLFAVVLKIGLVAAVSFAGAAAAVLVAGVAVSRLVLPLAAGWGGQPAAVRPGADATGWRLWAVALVALLLLILFLGLWGALVSAVLAVAAAGALVIAAGRTGGLDRPALWAVQQGAEVAILAGAVATL